MRLSFATFLFLLSGLALACSAPRSSDGVGDVSPEAGAFESKASLKCEPGAEHWRETGPPKRGGTLLRASGPIEHFDATKTGGSALTAAAGQLAQPLVEARECFYEDVVMVPNLAKGWEISPDTLTWTIKLREGVKWHNRPPVNGRPFTSADVAWMIEHNKREGLQRAFWSRIAHSEPDAHTVALRLEEPDADFLLQLGYRENVMLPREVKDQYGDFKTVAIGTGAFILRDYKQNQEYNLEANPDYYEKGVDGRALPYLAGVKTVVLGDPSAEVAALQSGLIDETDINGIEKIQADRIRQSNPLKLRVYEHFNPGIVGVWFDNRKAPFNDVRVRKAVSLALDAEEFIARYQGGAVRAGFLPATLTEIAWSQDELRTKVRPDLERAKRLLAEAGFQAGARKLVLKTGSNFQQDAELAQAQLQAIGLQTTVVIEGSGFGAVLRGAPDWDMGIGSPGGLLFPNYWLQHLLMGPNSPDPVRSLNDPEVERLSLAQSKEMDPAKRKLLIDQLQQRLYEVLPQFPLVTHLYYHARSCRLRNASLNNPTYNSRMPAEAWLDPAGC